MENASKALIMAGSILIALLVISLLVMFYQNISDTMNEKGSSDVVEQVAEFNKQYDVYYRDIYGSDLLSLANKVNDYNIRQAGEHGYQTLSMSVEFKLSTKIKKDGHDAEIVIEENSELTSTELQFLIEDTDTGWASIVKAYEKGSGDSYKIGNYKVTYLSGLRTNELNELFKDNIKTNENYIKEKVQPKIDRYLSYKSALSTLKSKVFDPIEFIYDDDSGRITEMKFVEK